MTDQTTRAHLFRALHNSERPLVLINAWDAAGARIVQAAGAAALATTSAGVSWSLGAADGGVLTREPVVDLVARIVAVASVPVSADIEAGYGATPDDVADTVGAVLAAGAVGINIEDAQHDRAALRAVDDQCARLAAARAAADKAGIPMFINARIDTFLSGAGGVAETVARASAYLEAGADGVFVPGVVDPDTIARLAAAIAAPLNILAGPGAPPVADLAKLGVARVSLGSSVAEAAYAVVQRAATEAFSAGTYAALTDALDYGSLNSLMRG